MSNCLASWRHGRRRARSASRPVAKTTVTVALAAGALLVAAPVEATELHLWIRAFIPAGTPAEAAGKCFKTDERSFESKTTASARVKTEFVLVTNASNTAVEAKKSGDQPYYQAGETVRLDCNTKAVLEQKAADVSVLKLGKPAIADGVVQIVATASAANPLTPPVLSPKIDYDVTFTWNTKTRTLTARFTVGRFPAFEAYAQLDNGPVAQLLAVAPDPTASPFALYDFGLGLNSRAFEATHKF